VGPGQLGHEEMVANGSPRRGERGCVLPAPPARGQPADSIPPSREPAPFLPKASVTLGLQLGKLRHGQTK